MSDANTFFIETVLAHHGVLGCFSEIVTNPATVDADGRLRISPFHDSAAAPHGCSLCPDNMCKVLPNSRTPDRSVQKFNVSFTPPTLAARGHCRQNKQRDLSIKEKKQHKFIARCLTACALQSEYSYCTFNTSLSAQRAKIYVHCSYQDAKTH